MRLLFAVIFSTVFYCSVRAQVIHFVFTSDLHYGITRPHFRGQDSVASYKVNAGEVAAINNLPSIGIKHIEGVLVTGDIANREEAGIQAASKSWRQFLHDYRDGITIKTIRGARPTLLVTPGNHDASNAAGHTKISFRDAGSMTGMLALEKHALIDTAAYDYHLQKLNYSKNIGGIHFVFVNIWPDSANRHWLERDLAMVNRQTPVLLFTHDQPQGDAKHFTNPDADLREKAGDKFEHLLAEVYKDTIVKSTALEQAGLVQFLQQHPNIKAWFHGHENVCEMYDYTGLHNEISLPVFRSDSPMKGEGSRPDETKLSFQVLTIDLKKKALTAKECLWNTSKQAGNWPGGNPGRFN